MAFVAILYHSRDQTSCEEGGRESQWQDRWEEGAIEACWRNLQIFRRR